MSAGYRAIQWNAQKWRYDLVVGASVALVLATFAVTTALTHRPPSNVSAEIILIRGTALCAFLMLHVVLVIGPLARLDRRFLPLLYNRRHLGVATFLVALAHGALATGFYHGFGDVPALVSLLAGNTQYGSLAAFPFEMLGIVALFILFLMAVTSHDFWLNMLTPGVWKALHMLVYVAYVLVVWHVALGALQSERHPIYLALLGAGVTLVVGLHVVAGLKERIGDAPTTGDAHWHDAGPVDELVEGRGRIVRIAGQERIALFMHEGRIVALSNVCAHQGGPIGEGRIVRGCVTCPWHGYQYEPQTGESPPPFTERIATYPVRVEKGRIYVSACPRGASDLTDHCTKAEASHG